MYQKQLLYIAPHLPEADWDELRSTPSNLVVCGPIVMAPLQDNTISGRDLLKWLEQRPTVMVNLGSLHGAEGPSSLAIARGLQTVLGSKSEVQVLWKLKYDWENDSDMAPILRPFIEAGRLRVTPWLDIEPSALLETGYICCSVHHGGANSFYEACRYVMISSHTWVIHLTCLQSRSYSSCAPDMVGYIRVCRACQVPPYWCNRELGCCACS